MTGSAGASAARASRYRWTTALVGSLGIADHLGNRREGEVGRRRMSTRLRFAVRGSDRQRVDVGSIDDDYLRASFYERCVK
jgi:hypothetical protein